MALISGGLVAEAVECWGLVSLPCCWASSCFSARLRNEFSSGSSVTRVK